MNIEKQAARRILEAFKWDGDGRSLLEKPFPVRLDGGKWTAATNLHAMVLIEGDMGYATLDGAPDVVHVLEGGLKLPPCGTIWPPDLLRHAFGDCPACSGRGYFTYFDCDYKCKSCSVGWLSEKDWEDRFVLSKPLVRVCGTPLSYKVARRLGIAAFESGVPSFTVRATNTSIVLSAPGIHVMAMAMVPLESSTFVDVHPIVNQK